MEVDSHIGAAMSGLIADARTLVDHARVEAQNHRFTYDEPMRVEALTQAVCDLALSFGEVRCLPCCCFVVFVLRSPRGRREHDVSAWPSALVGRCVAACLAVVFRFGVLVFLVFVFFLGSSG